MKLSSIFDPILIISILGLSALSLFVISSTVPSLVTIHLIYIVLGFILYALFASTDYLIWKHFVWFLYILIFILLILVFFTTPVRGAYRWFDFGWVRLQPSELVKPFIIIILAFIIEKYRAGKLALFLKPFFIFLPILVLIFRQPDLGNVIVFTSIFASLQIIANLPAKYLIITFVFFALLLPVSLNFLQPYQIQRLISFLSPQSDPLGAGYNALQAIIAIGSGRLLGLGYARGTQSTLLFLPEYHTDFIFASLVEELGFIGATLVLIFYFLLLRKILQIAKNCDGFFGKLICIGIFMQLFTQVAINIGMNLGLLPITGITLPLLSYGGSSIISTYIALGIVVSVARQKKQAPLVIR